MSEISPDNSLENLLSELRTLREKNAYVPPQGLVPQQPAQQPGVGQMNAGAAGPVAPGQQPPSIPPPQEMQQQQADPQQMQQQQGQPLPGMDKEVLGALERMAEIVDEIAERNKEMENRIQQYEARQAQVDGKYDMLMQILDKPSLVPPGENRQQPSR